METSGLEIGVIQWLALKIPVYLKLEPTSCQCASKDEVAFIKRTAQNSTALCQPMNNTD